MKITLSLLSLLLLCGNTSVGQSLSDSLIAHFPLDGNPNDVIGSLVPTVTHGNPGFCADRFGNANGAACFDGASFWSYGDVLDMDTLDFTLAAWVKVDTVLLPFEIAPGFISEGSVPICKGTTIFGNPTRAGYSLIFRQSLNNVYDLYGATGDETNDVRLSQAQVDLHSWTYISLSRCGDHQLLHINGILVADSLIPLQRNLNVDIVFSMGAMNRDPTSYLDSEWFIGSLDDVRIYRGRCLSQAEIDSLAQDVALGVQTTSSVPTMLFLPNPASDIIRLRFSKMIDMAAPVQVFDAMGHLLTLPASRINLSGGSITDLEIPIAGLTPGAYFVKVQSEHGVLHGRFIKE
ncbi:MAG: LamG-like jellyroll fold domain-containing protein [Flavobacteriales bacterium]